MFWSIEALLILILILFSNPAHSEGEVAHVVCCHLHSDFHGISWLIFSHNYTVGKP